MKTSSPTRTPIPRVASTAARSNASRSISEQRFLHMANTFQTLGELKNLRLLTLLMDGPKTIADIAGAMCTSRLVIARDVTTLYHASLVRRRVDGRRVHYELSAEWIVRIVRASITHARAAHSLRP